MATVKVSFLLLAILSVVALEVQCEKIVPGIPVSRFRSTRAANTCLGIFGPRCQDCRTQMNCVGLSEPISTVRCAEKDPKTPYCVNNACTATPDASNPDCLQPDKVEFMCTGEGYFPDPKNCVRYYICPGPLQKALAYDCPPNYVYRSKEKGCGKKINAADCPSADCSKTPNEWGVYKTDPAYYYFCNTDKKQTLMFACLDSVNTQFDPAAGACTFRCSKEGKFVDVTDCKSFYQCYKSGATWQVDHVQCPPKYSFNPDKLFCEKKDCTSQVTPPTPPPAEETTTASTPTTVTESTASATGSTSSTATPC